jgi:hypothetical protein
MRTPSSRRPASVATAAALGVTGLLGSALSLSATAGAEPPVPPNVWIQCSSFSGPNTTFPHPLGGCIARGEEDSGSGYTSRTAPGTETIYFNAPFLKGASLQLTNISNGAPAEGTSCPADHPARVGVSGVISATEPGTKQYDGSPVSATICANATDFILATGSTFTIYKK